MKKLILNVLCGVIISLIVFSISTVIFGVVITENGYDSLLKMIFTNMGKKLLIVCVIGIAVGIGDYLAKKYGEHERFGYRFIPVAYIIILMSILLILSRVFLSDEELVYTILYLAIYALTLAMLDFIKYVFNKNDISKINKILENRDKQEENK